jgi:hypothetical protein
VANPNPKTDHLEATRWKEGQSGNPAGSSDKQRLTSRLLGMLEDETFLKAGLEAANKGDFNFWKYIFERVDGKMPDKLEVKSKGSSKILKVPNGKRKRNPEPDDAGSGG